jgi:hypothetical protein
MTLSIGHRLIFAFGVILLMIVGFGWYQLISLREMRDFAVETIDQDIEALKIMRDIRVRQGDMRTYTERAWVAHFLAKANIGETDKQVPQQKWALAGERLDKHIDALIVLAEREEKQSKRISRKELWASVIANAKESRTVTNEIGTVVRNQFDRIDRDNLDGVTGDFQLLDELRGKFSKVNDDAKGLADQPPRSGPLSLLVH